MRYDLPDLGSQDFDREHGFPVIDGKADTVAVDDDDSGVHLFIFLMGRLSGSFFTRSVLFGGGLGGFSAYLEFSITAC